MYIRLYFKLSNKIEYYKCEAKRPAFNGTSLITYWKKNSLQTILFETVYTVLKYKTKCQ